MKKLFLLSMLGFMLGFAFAQTGTISGIAGKVEYQLPGKEWKPARIGDVVSKGTMISTGFKSTAVIKIANATITVKPITRLSLEEIIKTEAGTQTQVFLVSGRVSADVTPQANQTTDFKVSSPTATASVRGTAFEFDGVNLIVERGSVELQSPTLQFKFVSAGEFTYVASNGSVEVPAAVVAGEGLETVEALINEVKTSGSASGSIIQESETPPPVVVIPTANVVITVE